MSGIKKDTLLNILAIENPTLDRDTLFSLILCGDVRVNGEVFIDPRVRIPVDAEIRIEKKKAYVSRGGIKLEHALSAFNVDVRGKIFLDAGSSTGGFTDCLLRHGARKVYAVDVGYNQLDFSLRRDPRVVVYERRNIMHLTRVDFKGEGGAEGDIPDAAVCDLSFRSIRGAASHIIDLTRERFLIALVKPQFERMHVRGFEKRKKDAFKGIVENRQELLEIIRRLVLDLKAEGLSVTDVTESPIRGAKGNREFFFLLEEYKIKEKSGDEGIRKGILEKLEAVIFEDSPNN